MGAWVALAGIEFVLLGFFTFYLIRFFAKPGIPFYALAYVFVSWYLGFFGTMFLPIDIAEAWTSRYWVNVTEAEMASRNRSVADPWANMTRSLTPSGSGTPGATPSPSGTASRTASASFTPSGTPSVGGSLTGTRTPPLAPPPTPSRSPSHTRGAGAATPSRSRSSSTTPISACELGCDETFRALAQTPDGSVSALLRALWGGGGRAAQGGSGAGASSTPSPSPSPSGPNATLASPSPGPAANPFLADFAEVVVRNGPLESMWVSVYWATAVLTYVAVPLVQEYLAAGEFSARGRFCASLHINLVFYAVLALAGFLALAYVVVVQGATFAELFPLLISLANTSGLLIIVLLLGYGAAEVPRELWRAARPRSELRRLYFNAPAEEGSLFDAKNELGDILRDISSLAGKVGAMAADKALAKDAKTAEKLAALQEALPVVEAVALEGRALLGRSYAATEKSRAAADARAAARAAVAPEEDADEKGAFGGFMGMFKGDSKYRGVSLAKLAALNKRLKYQVGVVQKATHRWKATVLKAMELEWVVSGAPPPVPVKKATAEGKTYYIAERAAVAATEGRGSGRDTFTPPRSLATAGFVAQLPAGVDPARVDVMSEEAGGALLSLMCCPTRCGGVLNRALWGFKIHFAPYANLALAALAEAMSLLLLWSEATIWLNLTGLVKPNLSVFGQLLLWADDRAYKNDIDPTVQGTSHEYFTVLCVSFAPLAYMCLLSMYAVFKLKVLGMDISGNRNSDGYSLLVNASLMNRLQFSLAFNYLNVLFHSSNKEEFPDTAFLHSVGAKMSLSVVDWFLPLLMVLLYGACKLHLFDRVMRKLGYEERGSPEEGNLDHDTAVRDGQRVVVRARGLLGIGAEAEGGEEERERASEASRARMKMVLARMEARRRGEDPDAVGTLDSVALDVHRAPQLPPPPPGNVPSAPSSAAGDSGGGRLEKSSLSAFSGAGKGSAGASGGGGLAALAARARGAPAGTAPPPEPQHRGIGEEPSRFDPAFDELLAEPSRGVGGGGARGGAAAPAVPVEPPPTLAELMRGTRKPQGNTSLALPGTGSGGGGGSGGGSGAIL